MNTPCGVDHIRMLTMLSQKTREATDPVLAKESDRLRVIGSSLAILYEAATCHRKCHGGPHVLESLVGRAYNLGCAAYILTCRGFYDEALNLIRGIGEISNLISLSVVDKDWLRRWLSANRETRLRDFGPAKIRERLGMLAAPMMVADKDWYIALCEDFTHATPSTKPNAHNDMGKSHAGGVIQPDGVARCLEELATVLGFVAMPISKYFEFHDLFDELVAACSSVEDDDAS